MGTECNSALSHNKKFIVNQRNRVQPPADVLSKLANVFGTSIDYLVNGTIQNKAEEAIDDNLLLKQFKAVEQMKKKDKNVVTKLIDAFILKANLQQQLS
ncbi:helix-turn-helix domain-containing protein [Flavobacterium eburneipallidum]|uniref:helix-turn-helix domain-containing protein n=1 Tax=Flavobacterium eburneipallidum TaxID=3003263 RepID=UPI002482ED36|nr:hypothetical protein [Flavobacterium eburneipallidum]